MTRRLALVACWAAAGVTQINPESVYLTRYVETHHSSLAPILRDHYAAYGVPTHKLRETIQDTVMFEAECSLDSINSYGDGYEQLLLDEVVAGASVTDARYAAQDALAAELAGSAYGPSELENRLAGSHARFRRCMAERLSAHGLPPLPSPTSSPPTGDPPR